MKHEYKTKKQLINELAQIRETLRENQIQFAGILEIANEAIITKVI